MNKTNIKKQIMAYLYLSGIIIAMIIFGPSPYLYGLFILSAAFFILPGNYLLGLGLIIVLTIFFERFFTLQGLVLNKDVYKFYLLDAIICLSSLAWLIVYLKKKKSTDLESKLLFGWPEKILLFWLMFTAVYLLRSFFDINSKFEVAFSSFKNYFFYPLLYFLTLYSVTSEKKLKNIIHLILLAAVGLIGYIFIGFGRGVGLWTEFTPLSTAGVRYLAGTHAFYLSIALMFALALLLYKRFNSIFLSFLTMGFWTLGIGVSLMRHLWLATAVGIATLFVFWERQLKKTFSIYVAKAGLIFTTIFVSLFLIVSLMYFQGSLQKFNSGFETLALRITSLTNLSDDTSAAWRQDLWHEARAVWLTNPIFGVGFGRTILIEQGDYQNFEEIRNLHNSPLAILVQTGIIGLVILIILIGSVIILSLKSVLLNHELKPYYLGAIAAIALFLAASLFQPYLETNLMGIWLWILLGLLRTASIINPPKSK